MKFFRKLWEKFINWAKTIFMAEQLYTLKKKKDTEEYHLFRATGSTKECTPEDLSICKKMGKTDSEKNIFACLEEDRARVACANTGREVCGICVSDLYKTY